MSRSTPAWRTAGSTRGAIHLLSACADAATAAEWGPKLVSGEWLGTMALTEPQAGGFLLDKGFIELFRCNGSRFNEKIPESCSFGHVIYRPPFLDSFILKMIAQEP